MPHRFSIRLFLGFTLAISLVQAALADQASGRDGQAGRLQVMTQNLYVGADIFKILDPSQSIPENAADVFADIQVTDFPQRAESIADLAAVHHPHLIGLQEVSLIRTQCPDDIVLPPNDSAPNATDVYADYLQILLNALAARGLNYEVAASVTNADVELPVFNAGLLDCPYLLFDARLTDRDVVLRRGDVEAEFTLSANYQANLPVSVDGTTIVFTRGYNIVDVSVDGRPYRFVNTHLQPDGDPASNAIQSLQALELAETLNALPALLGDRIQVVVGDFNSDPAVGPTSSCLLPPDFTTVGECATPYTVMHGYGFIDTWTVRNGADDPGFTCCQQDLLMNPISWLDERIDFVWVRAPLGGAQGPNFLNAVHVIVVGLRPKARTADSLWPSDHAGVVAGMTFRVSK
jgi:hypothetical protein